MIPLFAPHTGTHRARRRPAAPGRDLLTDAELAALVPGGLQPFAYAPFDETEGTVWPGAPGRVETTLLADPEGGAA